MSHWKLWRWSSATPTSTSSGHKPSPHDSDLAFPPPTACCVRRPASTMARYSFNASASTRSVVYLSAMMWSATASCILNWHIVAQSAEWVSAPIAASGCVVARWRCLATRWSPWDRSPSPGWQSSRSGGWAVSRSLRVAVIPIRRAVPNGVALCVPEISPFERSGAPRDEERYLPHVREPSAALIMFSWSACPQ